MDVKKRSLTEIFDPTMRLEAPLFQRPYVWNEEKNWEPLWDSIQEVAERRDLPPIYVPVAVRVGSTVTDTSMANAAGVR
jgi:Protein of unknown function DUF262